MTTRTTSTSAWPYLLALFLACLVSFPTWLMMPFVGIDEQARVTATLSAFCVVGVGLVVYMRCCLAGDAPADDRKPGAREGAR
jgi:hypothetical protein